MFCSHCTAVVTIVTGKCAVRSCCTGPKRHCSDSLLAMIEEATSFLGDPVIWMRLGWRMPSLQGFILRVCCSQLLPLPTIPFCAPKKPSSPLDCHREDHPSLHLEPDIGHIPGCAFVPSLWTVKHCSGQLTCWDGLLWPWMCAECPEGARKQSFGFHWTDVPEYLTSRLC